MNRDGRESDDADRLLAQLATGGSPASQVPPAPSRSEEVLDWFTMAESSPAEPAATGSPAAPDAATRALPVIGAPSLPGRVVPPVVAPPTVAPPVAPAASDDSARSAPAWRPPFTVGQPSVQPVPVVPPGPVTPPAPFALAWRSEELDSEDAIRAAFRSLSGDTPADELPVHADAPAEVEAPMDVDAPTDAEAQADDGARPVLPRHPTAPPTVPAGWDERPAATSRPGFDDELWSALTEEEAVLADVEAPRAERDREDDGFPFIEVRGEAGPADPAATGAFATELVTESAANRAAPFPAFAAARGDDPFGQSDDRGSEPVDDLLAALGSGTARPSDDGSGAGTSAPKVPGGFGTPPAGGTPPGGPGDGPFGYGFRSDDDGGDDDERVDDDERADDGLDALGLQFDEDDDEVSQAPEAESPIAREIAETGYFWNLTPDPTAPDPKADPSGTASTVPSPVDRPSPFAEEDEPTPAEPEPVVPEPAWFEPSPAAYEPPATAAFEPPPTAAYEPPPTAAYEPPPTAAYEPPPTAAYEPPTPAGFESPQTGYDAAPPIGTVPIAGGAAGAAHTDPLAALFGPTAEHVGPTAPQAPPASTGAPFAAGAAGTTPVSASRAADPTAAARPSGAGGAGGATAHAASAGPGGGRRGGGGRTTRILLWVAAGLVVCIVLAGLFYVGTLLSAGGGEAGGPSAAPVETEAAVVEPTAPQPAGVHAWNTLFGGECIEPFVSVWEEEFTVVDCAAPHAAQLVYRGELPGDAAAPFPGEAELAAQMGTLCRADGIIDVGLVAGIPDLQVQAAFPVTEEQWAEGERTYYCFANRAGGEPLTVSITGPGPTA